MRKIPSITKNHSAQQITLTPSWLRDTAPTFQLPLFPQILQWNQLLPQCLRCNHANFQLSNLKTCSSPAAIGKAPWYKSQKINSTTMRFVHSAPTPKEWERWPIKKSDQLAASSSNLPPSMSMQSWTKLGQLIIQRRLFLPRNFFLREWKRALKDQRKLNWIPLKNPIHPSRKSKERILFTRPAFLQWAAT